MAYVKTAEELARYRQYHSSYEEHFQRLTVQFSTTEAFAREVLPPCFEVPAEPTGSVSIGAARVSYDGSMITDESEYATLKLRAGHRGVEGNFVLSAIVNGDMMISLGREAWGMPKKRGETRLYDDGKVMYGFSERRGTRLIELEAAVGPDAGPQPEASYRFFELKAWMAPGGAGLHHPPEVVAFDGVARQHVLREGDPESVRLRLTGTAADPVDTVPVLGINRVFAEYGVSVTTLAYAETLTDADYEPWVYGRSWDDLGDPALRPFAPAAALA
ncbi:MAG TPA: acetoacetate decarboxylase family protein [Baekduia sp.]|uniref:acetoacetate decarboxylase family protein n=1 Tax=Baekduia sp. TaxID=2600305 RepID=UPI002D7740F0|nr:acetoacetate decarboxylase family protein [Baekduia sp.]HET6509086.1 acetoacetate decarboxylase family protein [Baekduia sp.]